MTTIRHEVHARCRPEKVWALLADLEAVKSYNKTVKSVAVRGGQRTGVGAARVCDLLPSGRVVERVIEWQEGRAVGLEVAESDWPIHFMRWVTKLEAKDGGTRVTQDLEYRVKMGPLGWLLDRVVMKRKLTKTLDGVFAELARTAEAS
jgi:hypothetical protein